MTENTQPTEITFKDKQYKIADLSERAKTCWNHLVDLGKKEHTLRFQMDHISRLSLFYKNPYGNSIAPILLFPTHKR